MRSSRRFAFSTYSFFALCLAAVNSSAFAQSVSLEERLQRLENEVGELRKENQTLRAELGLQPKDNPPSVRPRGRETMLSIGGMLQVQGEFGDKGDSRFTTGNDRIYLRRTRLNMQGRFFKDFDFRIEGEFSGSLAESSGLRTQLTDGYVNWSRFDFANIRLGQFKTPYGFEQLAGDPSLLTAERSLVNDRLTLNRQIGVQVAGDVATKRVAYAVGVFNGSGVNTTANDNDRMLWVGRVSGVPWQGKWEGREMRWAVGANAFTSSDSNLSGQPAEFGFDALPGGTRDNIFTGKRHGEGVDTQLHIGLFDLWAEYLREHFEPADAAPAAAFNADGWYLQGAYYILPDQLQAALKYEVFDPNTDLGSNSTRTWTVGFNYFIKADDLKLQLDYLLTDIDGVPERNKKLLLRLQSLF